MRDEFVFSPERRLGLIFHIVVITLLIATSAWGLWRAANASIGPTFLLYLLPAMLAVGVVPMLAYRVYALQNAFYALERDGIRLRWGLRVEDIPMTDVLWVHTENELTKPPPLPWLRWPGAVLGVRRLAGVGEVEFLAARSRRLILIATTQRVFAISPADPNDFILTFQRFTEMGSLTPLTARAIYPSFLLSRVWAALPARVLILCGGLFSLVLLVWVSLTIPSRLQIPMGFNPDSSPGDLVPAVRLMLLPVINTFFFLIDLLLGLFFFRREESQPLAYLLWGSGALTPVLFLIAVYLIFRSG